MKKLMKPCGKIYSQDKTYLLLHPEPVAKDSVWNDGTYTFFVAKILGARTYKATTIVTNCFTLEFDNDADVIEVDNIETRDYVEEAWNVADNYELEEDDYIPEPADLDDVEHELPF
jgi:hypothetical protein